MNHEFWNEIGNLYFMCGAYEPAIHAYLSSIKLENTFGRSYSNLAMAYVQTGKYSEAIKLYRRSIELISDKKEKATTWNRLGILYRQIKEYDNALEAYQRADLIMPQENMEKDAESRADAKLPLTVSMPEINLDSILAKGNAAQLQAQTDLLTEINSEFEMAESNRAGSTFEDVVMSPDFENYSQTEDAAFEPPIATQSEWRLAYTEGILITEKPVLAKQEAVSNELENLNAVAPIAAKNEEADDGTQINASLVELQSEPGGMLEANDINAEVKSVESAAFF